MTVLYRQARVRYESKMRALGYAGKRAQAPYNSWNGWKNNSECAMGYLGGAWSTICGWVREGNEVIQKVHHFNLDCLGYALLGVTGDRLKTIWSETAVTPQSAAGGAAAGYVLCGLNKVREAMMKVFD